MSSFMSALTQPRLVAWRTPARLRRFLRKRSLRRVAHFNPAAFGAGHSATDKQKSALGIDADDLQILSGDALVTEVAGHLLAFEDLARILALAGRAVRAVRDRDAVRGAQAAEVPALHGAGEAFTDADAGDVNLLAGDEVLSGNHRADRQQIVFADAEFAHDRLRLDLGARELAALGLAVLFFALVAPAASCTAL